jgi:hypothetical protein
MPCKHPYNVHINNLCGRIAHNKMTSGPTLGRDQRRGSLYGDHRNVVDLGET